MHNHSTTFIPTLAEEPWALRSDGLFNLGGMGGPQGHGRGPHQGGYSVQQRHWAAPASLLPVHVFRTLGQAVSGSALLQSASAAAAETSTLRTETTHVVFND